MKHNCRNASFGFVAEPVEFNKATAKDFLQYCLGGVLYMPGTRNISEKILFGKSPAAAMVMCFEDAIREEEVGVAEENVRNHLNVLSGALRMGTLTLNDIPLIFVRVRNNDQFRSFAHTLTPEQVKVLSGFVFPKFDSANGLEYLECLQSANVNLGSLLYGMPILEGHRIAFKETRTDELCKLAALMARSRDLILNIRVGATDFSSLFGVRRGINYSIYDIATVRDCLADILNVFARRGSEYVISAPVWEYFLADKQDSLDHLLKQDIHRSLLQRSTIVNDAIDGLLREVVLDKANGFVGKTVIHPSHLKYVNGMQAVTQEEYEDAVQILDTSGGVIKSAKANKMNEINPHRSWAKTIAQRAKAYGVIENEAAYLKLILG